MKNNNKKQYWTNIVIYLFFAWIGALNAYAKVAYKNSSSLTFTGNQSKNENFYPRFGLLKKDLKHPLIEMEFNFNTPSHLNNQHEEIDNYKGQHVHFPSQLFRHNLYTTANPVFYKNEQILNSLTDANNDIAPNNIPIHFPPLMPHDSKNQIPIDFREPGGIAFTPDGKTVYVTSESDDKLVTCQVDELGNFNSCLSNKDIGSNIFYMPAGVTLDSKGKYAYITNRITKLNGVSVCNILSSGLLGLCRNAAPPENFDSAVGIAITPNDTNAFVVDELINAITSCTINKTTHLFENCHQIHIKLNESCKQNDCNDPIHYPGGIKLHKISDKLLAYITNFYNSRIVVCRVVGSNLENCHFSNKKTQFKNPSNLAFDNLGSAYVSNFGSSTLSMCKVDSTSGLFNHCQTVLDDQLLHPFDVSINLKKKLIFISSADTSSVLQCALKLEKGHLVECRSVNSPIGLFEHNHFISLLNLKPGSSGNVTIKNHHMKLINFRLDLPKEVRSYFTSVNCPLAFAYDTQKDFECELSYKIPKNITNKQFNISMISGKNAFPWFRFPVVISNMTVYHNSKIVDNPGLGIDLYRGESSGSIVFESSKKIDHFHLKTSDQKILGYFSKTCFKLNALKAHQRCEIKYHIPVADISPGYKKIKFYSGTSLIYELQLNISLYSAFGLPKLTVDLPGWNKRTITLTNMLTHPMKNIVFHYTDKKNNKNQFYKILSNTCAQYQHKIMEPKASCTISFMSEFIPGKQCSTKNVFGGFTVQSDEVSITPIMLVPGSVPHGISWIGTAGAIGFTFSFDYPKIAKSCPYSIINAHRGQTVAYKHKTLSNVAIFNDIDDLPKNLPFIHKLLIKVSGGTKKRYTIKNFHYYGCYGTTLTWSCR